MKLRTSLLLILALDAFGQSPHESIFKNLSFRSIGPATMGGRVDDFAVVESDPRIIYVGAAAGGIFKTVNGGTELAGHLRRPGQPLHRRLALAPSNPSILYVGTGEANNRQSSSWGNGVYKSMDAGATCDPHGPRGDPSTSAASSSIPPTPTSSTSPRRATSGAPIRSAASIRAPTAGATWTQTLFINEDTGVNDIAIDSQSPNILYATAYQRRRTVFGFDGGGPGSGLYRSTDGGSHWTKLAATARPARPPATSAAAPSISTARTPISSTP